MHVDDFDYDLPAERIAQTPVEPRDAARLLVDRGSLPPEHRHVHDLPELLRDGDLLVLNTAAGRAKWHNMKTDPRVSISISPVDEPYLNFSLKGRVVEMRTEDGDEVIDRLAHKYLGTDTYPYRRPDETRVTILVEVDTVAGKVKRA